MPHPSHDVPGTLRRAPAGFAHALCLDQNGRPERWQVLDTWGVVADGNNPARDDEVADWPIVYVPVPAEQWADKISRLPAPPVTDEQETAR